MVSLGDFWGKDTFSLAKCVRLFKHSWVVWAVHVHLTVTTWHLLLVGESSPVLFLTWMVFALEKVWSGVMMIQAFDHLVHIVTPGGRRFPALGKFPMNPLRPNEDKGKHRLGLKVYFSWLSLCPLELLSESRLLCSFPPAAPLGGSLSLGFTTKFSPFSFSILCFPQPCLEELHGQDPSDWQVPDQLPTRNGREENDCCSSSITWDWQSRDGPEALPW